MTSVHAVASLIAFLAAMDAIDYPFTLRAIPIDKAVPPRQKDCSIALRGGGGWRNSHQPIASHADDKRAVPHRRVVHARQQRRRYAHCMRPEDSILPLRPLAQQTVL